MYIWLYQCGYRFSSALKQQKGCTSMMKHSMSLMSLSLGNMLGKQWEEGKEAVVLYVSKVMESEHR